jgi:hypothetical protein
MKNHYYIYSASIILFLFIHLKTDAQAPDFSWAIQAGGIEADAASRIAADANGNSYVTGIFRDTASFGTIDLISSGSTDIFIAKYDPSGNVIWARKAGGTNIDAGKNIAVDDSGNSFITGEFLGTATFGSITLTSNGNYDTFIAKYDSAGNVLWALQSGGTGLEMGRGITVDRNGNCYLTGYFDGSAAFGGTNFTSNGIYDVYIAKYDASGNFQWAARAGSNDEDFGRNISVDGNGNSYITGTFRNMITFGGTTLTSNGMEDIFIAKYDAAGNLVWAKSAGNMNRDGAVGIETDSSGNSCITGEFQGTIAFDTFTLTSTGSLPDIFVARYDAAGNVMWARQAGGTGNDFGRNIDLDDNGNIYISGEFESTASFGSNNLNSIGNVDIFIAEYDAYGNVLWAKSAGGNSEDRASGIAIDGSGNICISGYFLGQSAFGNTTITSNGSSDAYIAKLGTVTELPATSGSGIAVYPNPFTNALTIILKTTEPAMVMLTNILGQPVYSRVISTHTEGEKLSLVFPDDLSSGAYVLQVKQGNRVQYVRLIRE